MRLVDHSDSSKEYLVEGHRFSIGSSLAADIVLEGLQETHVYINKEGKNFFIYNSAKDPFVSVNSLPFWKKKLKAGDIIEVGGKSFRVAAVASTEAAAPPKSLPLKSPAPFPTSNPSVVPEASTAAHEEVCSLPRKTSSEVEAPSFSDAATRPGSESAFYEEAAKRPERESPREPLQDSLEDDEIKDDQPSSLTDEEETVVPGPLPPLSNNLLGRRNLPRKEARKERSFSSYLLKALPKMTVALAILGAASFGSYIWIKNSSKKQELLASEGVADVAMALTYAKIKNTHVEHKSFTDPKFLKNNLALLLDDAYPALSNLDEQGKFTNSPYFLRIYATAGLNRFLVIAQPQAGFGEWLIARSAFVVDSGDMCLRKIEDIKSLNRLLVQTESLDDSSAQEITRFIKQNQSVSLETLAIEIQDPSLAPPKALALLRPGAEDYVYNAPRYHHIGEQLLRLAEGLEERFFTKEDLEQLREEAKAFASFKDLVLYSSKGLHRAFAAEKALSSYLGETSFLIGYLKFITDGTLLESHLLSDEDLNPSSEDMTRASRENVLARSLLDLKEQREQEISLAEQNISSFLREAKNSPFFTRYEALNEAVNGYRETLAAENEKFRTQLAGLFSQHIEREDFLKEVTAIHGDCAVDCLKAGRMASNALSLPSATDNLSETAQMDGPETSELLNEDAIEPNEENPFGAFPYENGYNHPDPVAISESDAYDEQKEPLWSSGSNESPLREELVGSFYSFPLKENVSRADWEPESDPYFEMSPKDNAPIEDTPSSNPKSPSSETPINDAERKGRLLEEIKEKKKWQELLTFTETAKHYMNEREVRNHLQARLKDLFYESWRDLPEDAFSQQNERIFRQLLEAMNLSPFETEFYLGEFATRKQASQI